MRSLRPELAQWLHGPPSLAATQLFLKFGVRKELHDLHLTMPKKALEVMGLSIGDRVIVDIEPKRKVITVKAASEIRPEVIAWTEGFIKKYKKALDELARR